MAKYHVEYVGDVITETPSMHEAMALVAQQIAHFYDNILATNPLSPGVGVFDPDKGHFTIKLEDIRG